MKRPAGNTIWSGAPFVSEAAGVRTDRAQLEQGGILERVRQAISDLAGDWLAQAGVSVPRRPDGSVAVPLEISPLYALDAEELKSKIDSTMRITGPTYLNAV